MAYESMNNFLKNTRRHRRFPVETMGIRLRARAEGDPSGAAEDYKVTSINLGGALMEGTRIHPPESKLLIELLLPENVRISLTARVTACHSVKAKERLYDIGVEFISMTDIDRGILKKFIQWLYLKDAGFTE